MMKMWRLAPVMLALLVLPRPVAAQEWIEYTNTQDRFTVNFPSQPTVQEITYTSWLEGKFPARVYTVERGRERYSVMRARRSVPRIRRASALAMRREGDVLRVGVRGGAAAKTTAQTITHAATGRC